MALAGEHFLDVQLFSFWSSRLLPFLEELVHYLFFLCDFLFTGTQNLDGLLRENLLQVFVVLAKKGSSIGLRKTSNDDSVVNIMERL